MTDILSSCDAVVRAALQTENLTCSFRWGRDSYVKLCSC